MGILSPLVKLLGVSALTDAMDALTRQFDAIEARLAQVEKELAEVRKRNDAVFHGWELMSKARSQLPHAPAADPHPDGETIQERARRVARHVSPNPLIMRKYQPDPDDEEGGDPPPDHV